MEWRALMNLEQNCRNLKLLKLLEEVIWVGFYPGKCPQETLDMGYSVVRRNSGFRYEVFRHDFSKCGVISIVSYLLHQSVLCSIHMVWLSETYIVTGKHQTTNRKRHLISCQSIHWLTGIAPYGHADAGLVGSAVPPANAVCRPEDNPWNAPK